MKKKLYRERYYSQNVQAIIDEVKEIAKEEPKKKKRTKKEEK